MTADDIAFLDDNRAYLFPGSSTHPLVRTMGERRTLELEEGLSKAIYNRAPETAKEQKDENRLLAKMEWAKITKTIVGHLSDMFVTENDKYRISWYKNDHYPLNKVIRFKIEDLSKGELSPPTYHLASPTEAALLDQLSKGPHEEKRGGIRWMEPN